MTAGVWPGRLGGRRPAWPVLQLWRQLQREQLAGGPTFRAERVLLRVLHSLRQHVPLQQHQQPRSHTKSTVPNLRH